MKRFFALKARHHYSEGKLQFLKKNKKKKINRIYDSTSFQDATHNKMNQWHIHLLQTKKKKKAHVVFPWNQFPDISTFSGCFLEKHYIFTG